MKISASVSFEWSVSFFSMTRSYFISFFFLDLMLSLSNAARNIEEAEGLVEAGEFFSFCSIFSQTVTERDREIEDLFSWLSLWPERTCCDWAVWLTVSHWEQPGRPLAPLTSPPSLEHSPELGETWLSKNMEITARKDGTSLTPANTRLHQYTLQLWGLALPSVHHTRW